MTVRPTVGFDRAAFKQATGFGRAELEEATRFLTALGDPVRLQILYLLGDKGHRNVGDIARNFRLSQPAISHHLKVLKDAGLLDSEKVGQEVFYLLKRDHIVATLRMLADVAAAWESPT